MEQKELKEILSNFGPNSGTQLKYYIITSFYPTADKGVIKDIGDFNAQTFSRIASAVRELDLPPLTVNAMELNESPVQEEIDWKSKYNELIEASATHELELINTIEALKKEQAQLTYDLQGAQMKTQYLERELEDSRAQILKLERVKF